jgi:transposase
LQPHKNEYWLFPKIDNWNAFVLRVALICQLILESVQRLHPHRHLISVDEKTGIQALSRLEAVAPDSGGCRKRREFEYKRNGTTCLMAAIDVGRGVIVHQRLNPTRKEEDFAEFILQAAKKFPDKDEVIFMADQLNTHLSESLVIWVAGQVGFTGELGKKDTRGILKNQESRKDFLENPQHRIRFVFTPKHCSWLNPIENWFAKLQRHVISNGNFASVEELVTKIEAYIVYYNKCLIKPLKWKFKGFIKAQQLKNANYQ